MPFLLLLLSIIALQAVPPADWVYVQNDQLKVGVRRDAGACIGFLASVADGKNVLNSYDHGRFIQQSYYGRPDDSHWVKQPWRYNPVQGGDYRGNAATLLEFKTEGARLYSKTRPKHWATGADTPETTLEQWLEVSGEFLKLRARMTYSGTEEHPRYHQEIPAVFLQPEYHTLVLHDGKAERRWQPGWPNEHVKLPRHWAMYLDDASRGIGIYVPAADEATCYRFGKAGERSACSYVAPLTTFALTPGKTFEYEAWFTLGTEEEIRKRLAKLTGDK